MTFTSQVETSYSFQDQYLIGHDGKRYLPINFENEWHAELDYALKDPIQTQTIYSAYKIHIEKTLSEESQTQFWKALVKLCYHFGSREYPPIESLTTALVTEGFAFKEWHAQYSDTFNQFIQAANKPSVEFFPEASDITHVVITTTFMSGGNLSAAKAIKAYLKTFGNRYRVTIIDSEAIAENHDPFMQATGLVTLDKIYLKVIQQEHQFERGFKLRDEHKKVARYIQSSEILEMKRAVAALKPHIILSTRNFVPDDHALCSLGVPVRIVYCDYEVGLFLFGLVGRIHPLIKCWMPALKPRVFRFFLHSKRENAELYQESLPVEEIMRRISTVTHASYEKIRKQYKLFGFPTRQEIRRIEDSTELSKIRKEWGLRPGERCVPIVMGVNGVGILEDIFNTLLKEPKGMLATKYIFICGRNEKLKERLEQKLASTDCQRTTLDRSQIYGFAEPKEINELLNIASIQLSKIGGSTVADVLLTGTPLFVMGQYPWEEVNGEELRDHKLAYYYQNNGESLSHQIESAILDFEQKHGKGKPVIARPNWKDKLIKSLDKLSDQTTGCR